MYFKKEARDDEYRIPIIFRKRKRKKKKRKEKKNDGGGRGGTESGGILEGD